jgi:hypothetical protein
MWWGRLHIRNTNDFTGFPRNQNFPLLETSITLVGIAQVLPHKIESVQKNHSHVLIGISEVP